MARGQHFLTDHVPLVSLWEYCSFAFCYSYDFLQRSDCLSHCDVPVSGINDPVFTIHVPNDALQPNFSLLKPQV